MDILELVKKAICKVEPGLDESKIVPAALLKEDLDLDSLDRVELALALEDELGLYLQDEEMRNIFTVGDIVALIGSKLKVEKTS